MRAYEAYEKEKTFGFKKSGNGERLTLMLKINYFVIKAVFSIFGCFLLVKRLYNLLTNMI